MNKSTIIGGLAVVAVLATGLLSNTGSNAQQNKMADSTVMITDMSGRSGGTGVIVSSSDTESKVLTNAHVCGLLPDGGRVVSNTGKTVLATAYKLDDEHDLCLIKVAANLGPAAKLASTGPQELDKCSISGHPSLLPTTITSGHIGSNMQIQVMTGVEDCTTDTPDELAMLCIFFGGIPVVKEYESTFATATIMAGSSGSAVYNEDKELIGLAFAGSGDLSYAHTVPYNYVQKFLKKNVADWSKPNYKLNILKLMSGKNKSKLIKDMVRKCESGGDKNPNIEKLCKVIVDTVKWQNPSLRYY